MPGRLGTGQDVSRVSLKLDLNLELRWNDKRRDLLLPPQQRLVSLGAMPLAPVFFARLLKVAAPGTGLTAGRPSGIDRRSMPKLSVSLKIMRVAESLMIGAVGGFVFNAARFPGGWLAGSMSFAAVAALAGRTVYVPAALGRAASIVMGITIGGAVTPDTLRGMTAWPLSIAMVALSVAAVTLATYTYLTRVHGWNGATAIYASIPGGLAQVMSLAAEDGRRCDIRAVAIVQTLRVVILTVVVPVALSLTGRTGAVR
ncbi:MAG: AbrB family transcriptional regulator, partial [Bradyrhizobiaceae bacterium]|nr:AbrB family transcriptional regulator [Bradyrhizobiaceae bacterium]